MSEVEIVLAVLALIDLALIANLPVMVILSGYETFVSSLDLEEGREKALVARAKVDASTLKIKLAVSIVAISSIHLLKAFMHVRDMSDKEVLWLVIVHLTFVVSALLMAVIDKIVFAQHRH
ncbi:MAG: YqhA family protein [Chromatiales bacterium]|nr:YqhA family protein [Chromatiales bacterium]